jgi:exonuclease SbcC
LGQSRSIVNRAQQKVERLARHHEVPYEADQSSDELQRRVAGLIPTVAEAARHAAERRELSKQHAAARGEAAETAAAVAACDQEEAVHREARTDAAAAVSQAEAAVVRISVLVGELTPLEMAEQAGRDRDAALAERDKMKAGLDEAKAQLTELDTDIAARSADITQLKEAVDLLPRLTAGFTDAEKRYADTARLVRLKTELTEAQRDFVAASEEHTATARAFALGVAPRLARQLTDGEPCLVCGSTEHPAPAAGDDDLIDQDRMNEVHMRYNQAFADLTSVKDAVAQLAGQLGETSNLNDAKATVEAARARLGDAEAARDRLVTTTSQLDQLKESRQTLMELTAGVTAQIEGFEAALAQAREALGGESDTPLAMLSQRADAHRSRAVRAREEAAALTEARSRVKQADDQLALIATKRTELTAKLSAAQAMINSLSAQIGKLDDSLALWNGIDLVEREAGLELLVRSISDLAGAIDTMNLNADRVESAGAELDAALAKAQLRSVQEALDCELDAEAIQRLEALHGEFKARSLDCDSQLRQLAELNVPETVPDLDKLADAAQDAQSAATSATGRRVGVQHVVEQALNLVATAEERLGHITSLTEIADRKTQVARLCDAKGASKIGLEGFVLRSHMHDVVVQANIRLDNLSNGRYQMVLAEEALSAQGEWGLDLTIIDAHTGTERPVTTLSGGETFYTSLSLALGLSDVLSNRGATSISSVFIDEGFGALDEYAIDDTIDVLNQLRSDGVTIGVITHVGALRDALPAGITVQQLPGGGSRVVQVA